MHKVVIVIINWNGWKDTLECLESIFVCDYDNHRVIVCDNGSTDDSIDFISAWARGEYVVGSTVNPVSKPIRHAVINRDQAERGEVDDDIPLVIVDIRTNLGFAGGNNVGIKLALSQADKDYVWLLNNDTQVDSRAILSQVMYMQQNERAGICGAVLCEYQERGKVQTLGSIFNRWLGVAKSVGAGIPVADVPSILSNPRFHIDYPIGASLFVSRKFLKGVGLMDEDYFLYFEEVDWVTRAGSRYEVSVCPDCYVYHKEGASIGTNRNPRRRSLLSDFYALRNRVLFAKKHFPFTLPTVFLGLLLSAAIRIYRGQWQAALVVLRIIMSGGLITFDPAWLPDLNSKPTIHRYRRQNDC
jgi:GT2 family glycosyltransferase